MLHCRSLGGLSILFGQVVRGVSAGGRVFEYLQLEPRISLHGGKTVPISTIKGTISFDHVTFAYQSRPNQVSAMTCVLCWMTCVLLYPVLDDLCDVVACVG